MIRQCILLVVLLAGCSRDGGSPASCSEVKSLLDQQRAAIAEAEVHMDENRPITDVQGDLSAVVAGERAVFDQCILHFLEMDRVCLERSEFARLQDIGSLLRTLHTAPLSENARDRSFVDALLKVARDGSHEPLAGRTCHAGG